MSFKVAGKAVSGVAGGFSMGTLYAYSTSDHLPVLSDHDHDHMNASEAVVYAINDDPAVWGVSIGAAALLGGRWSLLGLLLGTVGASSSEHSALAYARSAYLSVRGDD